MVKQATVDSHELGDFINRVGASNIIQILPYLLNMRTDTFNTLRQFTSTSDNYVLIENYIVVYRI